MKYRVKVKNANKIFMINNNPVRSPFECFINENQLPLLKARIKFFGLSQKDYEIELISIDAEKNKDYSLIVNNDVKPPENINKKENVITEVNNINKQIDIKPKQKILEKNEIKIHQKNPLPINNTNINKEPEQINNKVNLDTEVKIEELTIKSSSILDKFLNSEF